MRGSASGQGLRGCASGGKAVAAVAIDGQRTVIISDHRGRPIDHGSGSAGGAVQNTGDAEGIAIHVSIVAQHAVGCGDRQRGVFIHSTHIRRQHWGIINWGHNDGQCGGISGIRGVGHYWYGAVPIFCWRESVAAVGVNGQCA